MDAEIRRCIFEPSFTTKPRDQGAGLGLATVYGVVKQSGGHIRVYSERGRGTTFKLYFPQFTGVEAGSPRAIRRPEGLQGYRDRAPGAAGIPGLEASTAAEALALAEQNGAAVHLLLTDLIMLHMNGRELADRMHALCPEARVLHMSGYTNAAVLQRGVLEPGIHFIEKPFKPEALARKVRRTLDGG